ncbi:MAG: dTDP-glucose 4,6-dehydratase [Desulfobacteraceae bacterium 4572_87]|nr:MAG: dTDP-glucose 4,6-dehydratase [Desulfobacteraceae bacterium 4572_87]
MENMLVTGGCGFIGSNFIRYLLEESDFKGRVVNVDSLTYAGNPENLTGIEDKYGDRYVFVKGDICDTERMTGLFDEYHLDSVCHFAAESHVDRSIVGPGAFIETNIVGTFNLLEAARSHQAQLELFHHVSTDEVFGSLGKEGLFKETTPYQPNSPYSASKASSDHLVRAYHETYGLPVTISNCSNNYGPYQFPEKLIPLVILNAMEDKPLPIYGDGLNVRDWLYVRDHCTAVWTIMKNGKRGETYNIGGNHEMENIRIVEILCDLINALSDMDGKPSRRTLITYVKDRLGHDRRYAIDSGKLKNDLGWVPEESFQTGIEKTLEWYLAHQAWIDRVRSGAYQDWIREHYEK